MAKEVLDDTVDAFLPPAPVEAGNLTLQKGAHKRLHLHIALAHICRRCVPTLCGDSIRLKEQITRAHVGYPIQEFAELLQNRGSLKHSRRGGASEALAH